MTEPAAAIGPGAFAVRLRRLREAAALTQEELAERAGLTVKAVGALERGERRRPYPHTVRVLAEALQLDESARTAFVEAVRHSGEERPTEPSGPPAKAPDDDLLGRDLELRDVVMRLRAPGTRLLTITGPGGVGKTRLATSAASAVAADFPDGVAVVELAAVREVALVLPTIGRVLGLTQVKPTDVLEAVAAFVGRRRHLIVMDNLEHLLDAAPDLAVLLDRCPGLVVLATSRAPLRLRLEQDYPLGPLALPRTDDVATVAASPAAQVFLERARAVDPALELSAATAPAVAAICARLDGLPLALELAAAHARLLPPAALLDRLSSALRLVRSRDRPERHRTMTATLDWSHDLLTRDEQRLLRRLSVFAGGFSLTAAEQVAGDDGAVFAVLAGLVEQSLVTPDVGNEARYRMLEPVREYASERLRAAGEVEQQLDRHADYFCSLAEQAGRELRTGVQAEWLDRLERDHNNLRVALGTLRERGDLGRMARLGADTWLYWVLRGHAGEARAWLEDLVGGSSTNGMTAVDRAAAHLGLAGLRYALATSPAPVRPLRTLSRWPRRTSSMCGRPRRCCCRALPRSSRTTWTPPLLRWPRPPAGPRRPAMPHAGPGAVRAGSAGVPGRPPGPEHGDPGRGGGHRAAGQAAVHARVVLNMQAMVAELTGADDVALDQLEEAAELAAEVGTTWTLVYTLPALGILAARRGLFELATVRRELDPEEWDRAETAGRALAPVSLPGLAATIRRHGRS